MTARCLYCYNPLAKEETDFHPACSKKLFGKPIPPELPYSEDQLEKLAEQVIKTNTTVTGVQPKLSLHLASEKDPKRPGRFTIVGLWGGYILKPPNPNFPELPEVEDLTLHLADIAKISVVPHSLIRLGSGNLAYITKRIDRVKSGKLHMEDMCQLTEKLTEHKYRGSYEQIAKAIQEISANPGLDVVNFFELVVFSFITGNSDMHLKNFSLVEQPDTAMALSPAYDLVSTKLVYPADDEELALTLNGKKKKLKKADFIAAFTNLKLDDKQQENIFKKMLKALPAWVSMIENSFISNDFKAQYLDLIKEQLKKIS